MNDITGTEISNGLSSEKAKFQNVNIITKVDITLSPSRNITIDFSGSTFQDPFSIFSQGSTIKLIFNRCVFHSSIVIINTSGFSDISFLSANLHDGLKLSSECLTSIIFDNAAWKGKIILERLEMVGSFKNVKLLEANEFNSFSFLKCKFPQNISFEKS